jgi:hypothetical protein
VSVVEIRLDVAGEFASTQDAIAAAGALVASVRGAGWVVQAPPVVTVELDDEPPQQGGMPAEEVRARLWGPPSVPMPQPRAASPTPFAPGSP